MLILLPEAFKFLAIPEAIAPQLRQVLYGLLLVFFTALSPSGPDRRIPRRAEIAGPTMTGSTLLRLEALSKSFGGLHAVSDLSFDVKAGTITSLIGGNGAGKTTAFNLITGNLAPDAGHIYFRGARVDGLPPHKVARAGIARGFQELRLFNRLSATRQHRGRDPGPARRKHHPLAARRPQPAAGAQRHRRALRMRLLHDLTIEAQATRLPSGCPTASRSCSASAVCSPAQGELLLLDEPTSGFSPGMVEDFCARMRAPDASRQNDPADRAQCRDRDAPLRLDRRDASGRPRSRRAGRTRSATMSPSCTPISASRREARHAECREARCILRQEAGAVRHRYWRSPSGRIAAVIGPNGAGKSTVLRAVFGLGPQREGAIRLDGKDLQPSGAAGKHRGRHCLRAAGRARVPRPHRCSRTCAWAAIRSRRMLLQRTARGGDGPFPILRERRAQKAGALSGGERQMLAFGMALMLRPRLLLIDEPSIGLAPMLVTQIFDTIVRIRDEFGTAVLIVEQQAQQILRIADQVFVIRAGRLISQGPVEQLSRRGRAAASLSE